MAKSAIEWTESSWNPLTGCTRVSPGCAHCYAERMAKRLQAMGQPNYKQGFNLAVHTHALDLPLRWKKPQMVFVNSMSDLFHEEAPEEFVQEVFKVMHKAHWHCFQVLTKRAKRLWEMNSRILWPDNVWMGVSVETQQFESRIECLRRTHAKVKFLSLEPLLGALPRLNLKGIDWVIVGGGSGPKARPLQQDWVIDIRDQCKAASIPFFFKQWGGFDKKKSGRTLQGRIWNEFPKTAQIHPLVPMT